MSLRGRTRSREEEQEGVINVSPLIDVVFILLIFFIVSATFVSIPGIDVTRPKAVTADTLDKSSILFALSAQNRIFHGGEEIPLRAVSNVIETSTKDRNKPVVIQTDKWADASVLAKLIAEAKIKASSVSIATKKTR